MFSNEIDIAKPNLVEGEIIVGLLVEFGYYACTGRPPNSLEHDAPLDT
jgi:hypothetical protein